MSPEAPPPIPMKSAVSGETPGGARAMFATRSLGWLIAVDALWTVPDVVGVLGAPVLVPACLVATGVPVFLFQRRAGDTRVRAFAKGALCGVLAALPFPVCGTAFGAAMLAFARR